jgi:hypothetical protein
VFHPDVLGEHILMSNEARQFEITVVDAARGVLEGDEGVLDGLRKPGPPYHRTCIRNKPDASHTLTTRADCAQARGVIFDNFFQSRGPMVKFQRQGGKVVELVANGCGDAYAVVCVVLLEACLKGRKQTMGTRDRVGHAAKFADYFVPCGCGDAVSTSKFGEDVVESLGPVLGQLDRSADCVDDPPQHRFPCFPHAITLAQLLERGWLLLRRNAGVGRLEDFVERVEKDARDMVPPLLVSLYEI